MIRHFTKNDTDDRNFSIDHSLHSWSTYVETKRNYLNRRDEAKQNTRAKITPYFKIKVPITLIRQSSRVANVAPNFPVP